MLVQFMVKNVLSFKDETVLDMSAVNAYKEHASNLIDIGIKEKFLKVAAIYGANASGKSNLCTAMMYFQEIIRQSFNNVEKQGLTAIAQYYAPFAFEKEKENSEFQIVEMIGDDEYRYGFEYNAECIVAEWLYRKSIKTNRLSIIFERNDHFIGFGASVRKECDMYKEQIPPETLVLSFFNKLILDLDIFKNVYASIMDTLVDSAYNMAESEEVKKYLHEFIDREKENLIEFLTAIDTGIKNITCSKSGKQFEIYTEHVGRDGSKYQLSLYDESEGTIESIMLYFFARVAITTGRSLFIDELNIKLHPLLLKFIIDLFYDRNSGAQLIYTTHDTTLMDKKFFRRDQIWFVQKDEFGYSELTALSEFKVRSDASFEKDYLAGVYGGIPLIKEFELKEGE